MSQVISVIKPRETKWYGWKPDLPDARDHEFTLKSTALRLPKTVDLRTHPNMPPVYDQGALGSCTANAIAAAKKFKHPDFPDQPSRLYIYYNERAREGTTDEDAGAYIRDGMSSLRHQGACSETLWAYDISAFAIKPPTAAYQQGAKYPDTGYERVPRKLYSMKYAIFKERPIVFGFTVYESFESDEVARTGFVPMPGPSEEVLGGHAVLAVGYEDLRQCFICRNSWNTDWGMEGYFYMPYDYLLDENLSDDFWVLK
jgi:C1A family cysteine protease